MFILNVIIGILIYICIAFIIGKINFKEKIKKAVITFFNKVPRSLMFLSKTEKRDGKIQ